MSSGSTVARKVTTAVTVVQPSFISCPAPDVFATEIVNGTQIKVTVLPGPSNVDVGLFSVPAVTYTKNTITTTGSFQDSQGHIFDNVLHYGCYNKFMRGMSIQNKTGSVNNSKTGETASFLYGTQFCVSSASGSSSQSASCPNTPPNDYSAQSYYYNLYIRNSEHGDINQFNDNFICPMVQESLHSTGSVGTSGQPWPLDSSFAVSLSPTTVFSVGIVSNTALSNGTSTQQNTSCFSSSTTSSTSTSTSTGAAFVNSCLGFAARVNSDGTCPSFTNSSGLLQATYRLRRYIAIYPPVFDTGGKPLTGKNQGLDTIYVLDRPIKGPSNINPQKSYTMLGPKPCPFAYFDRKGVASTPLFSLTTTYPTPAYVSTGDIRWDGKNVDGIELPNSDSINSCSASLPHLSQDNSSFSIATVNVNNRTNYQHLYIRPAAPFIPHYEEDTDFQACSPQAVPLQDPPLHFSRDPVSGRVAWCAESYPTQNTNIQSLDPAVFPTATPTSPTGNISPYTSHTVKNSNSSSCTATFPTIPSLNYNYDGAPARPDNSPAPLYARHPHTLDWPTPGSSTKADQTCDRTVTTQGMSWTRFPLLAPETDIENSISTDASYMCLVTYDNNGPKTKVTTPSDGCCNPNNVRVITGTSGPSVAHLEPDISCGIPNY